MEIFYLYVSQEFAKGMDFFMKKLVVKDLYKNTKEYANKEITLEGWVRTVRDSKTFGFIELNDGSFFKNIQIVISDKLENFKEL